MIRVPWQRVELAELTALYFTIKDWPRQERMLALASISKAFVRRADRLGIEHDEKYRNVNGMAHYYEHIRYIDTNGEKGLRISGGKQGTMMRELVEEYKRDPVGFGQYRCFEAQDFEEYDE